MPYGHNMTTCSECGKPYITGDCIDLLGKCNECETGFEISSILLYQTVDDASKKELKEKVSKIMIDALSGRDQDLRTSDGFIRWGLVEKRIGKAIDDIPETITKRPSKKLKNSRKALTEQIEALNKHLKANVKLSPHININKGLLEEIVKNSRRTLKYLEESEND